MSKPVMFVGSSTTQLPLVTSLLVALEDQAVVKPWKSAFTPGVMTLNALISNANEADFALFIFGPDDWTESKGVATTSPRDNVVFEAGLFGAVLGWHRSIIVHARDVKLPSDLLGLTLILYDPKGDPDHQAQVVAAKISGVIGKHGWRGSESVARHLEGHWWQYTLSAAPEIERSVVALIRVRRQGMNLELSGVAWSSEGTPHAMFESKATSVSEANRRLFYYWEGSWPGHKSAPLFFGKGEIVLDDAERASGYFTVRSEGEPDPRETKHCVYRRASAVEEETMRSEDAAAKRILIERQLAKWKEMAFDTPRFGDASPATSR